MSESSSFLTSEVGHLKYDIEIIQDNISDIFKQLNKQKETIAILEKKVKVLSVVNKHLLK